MSLLAPSPTPFQPKVQHIWCSATIYKKMEDVFTGFILAQSQSGENISEYIVYLNSGGGSPFSGIALYSFVKSLPQKTTVYNMGSVDSAGVLFFLGFQNRIGVPDCSFMIHQTTLPRTILPEYFNVFDLNTQGANLKATDEKSHSIIEKETQQKATKPLSLSSIAQAALNTTTYHAHEAQEHGFIERIDRPTLPSTGVLYITDQYLSTLKP